MSLLFGRLTQDFINFESVLRQANDGQPTAVDSLQEAAAHFKHMAALDASYLVYIGSYCHS